MASRVCGWHFGGSYRSSELCKAPGAVFLWRSSIPICTLKIWRHKKNEDDLAFLCCLAGSVGDMEFTAANIHIFGIGEHRPPFFKGQCEGVVWSLWSLLHTSLVDLTLVMMRRNNVLMMHCHFSL